MASGESRGVRTGTCADVGTGAELEAGGGLGGSAGFAPLKTEVLEASVEVTDPAGRGLEPAFAPLPLWAGGGFDAASAARDRVVNLASDLPSEVNFASDLPSEVNLASDLPSYLASELEAGLPSRSAVISACAARSRASFRRPSCVAEQVTVNVTIK